MTVLHLVSSPWWSGAGPPAAELARALAGRGHRVLFACAEGDRLAERAEGMGLERPGGFDLRRTHDPRQLLRQRRALRGVVRGERVEIIHCHLSHDHWLAAFSGLAGATGGRGVSLVRTFHSGRAVRGDPLHRWLFRRTDVALAPNGHIARLLRERAGLPAGRVREVRGGVDLPSLRPLGAEERRRARERVGAGPEDLLVGILARMQPRRRHAELLEAFAAARREVPRARLLVVGKGEGRGELEGLAGRLGIGDAVTFTGYWEGELREVLGALDLFVLLAPGSEGSGRALLEAQAMGLPSLAVDRDGLADAVERDVTALVVPAGGPGPIAEGLLALLRDPSRRESLGRAARRRALEELDWAKVAGRVEAIYGECLRGGRVPPGAVELEERAASR